MPSTVHGDYNGYIKHCIRNRLTDIENKPAVAKGKRAGGGMEQEVGVSGCKL